MLSVNNVVDTPKHTQMENTVANMKPTKELLELAREKAKMLKPHQTIRLCGAEYDNSFYLFNFLGATYIGHYMNEPLGKFFKSRPVYNLTDNNTGKVTARMQRLARA